MRDLRGKTMSMIFQDPLSTLHPYYTVGLRNLMPRLDEARREKLDPIPGNPSSLINLPLGY